MKSDDGVHIEAFCQVCKQEQIHISGREETERADGMMEVDPDEQPWRNELV